MGAGSKVLTFLMQMEADIFPSNPFPPPQPHKANISSYNRTINMNQIPLMSIYLGKIGSLLIKLLD